MAVVADPPFSGLVRVVPLRPPPYRRSGVPCLCFLPDDDRGSVFLTLSAECAGAPSGVARLTGLQTETQRRGARWKVLAVGLEAAEPAPAGEEARAAARRAAQQSRWLPGPRRGWRLHGGLQPLSAPSSRVRGRGGRGGGAAVSELERAWVRQLGRVQEPLPLSVNLRRLVRMGVLLSSGTLGGESGGGESGGEQSGGEQSEGQDDDRNGSCHPTAADRGRSRCR